MIQKENWTQRQEGGDHYRGYTIQPLEFSLANKLQFCEGNVIKLIVRHRDKGGAQDLRKAIHYIEAILEHEYGV